MFFLNVAEIDLESQLYPDARSATRQIPAGEWRVELVIEAFGYRAITRTETFVWRLNGSAIGTLSWG
jgi:hypothetical protein